MDFETSIGKIAVRLDADGKAYTAGEVVGYISRPTYILKRPDGTVEYAVHSQTRLASPAEEIDYWRGQVADAGTKIQRPKPLNIRVECGHMFKRRNCPGCYEGVVPGLEPYR